MTGPSRGPHVVARLREAGLLGEVLRDLLGLDAPPRPGSVIACVRHERHKNEDRHPSLLIAKNGAGAECLACGLGKGGLLALACDRLGLLDKAAAARALEDRYLGNGQATTRGSALGPEAEVTARVAAIVGNVERARVYLAGHAGDPDVLSLLAAADGTPAALAAVGGGIVEDRGTLRILLPLIAPVGRIVGGKLRPGTAAKEQDMAGSRGGLMGEVGRLAVEPAARVLLLEGGHDLLAVVAAGVATDHVRLALPGALRFDPVWAEGLQGREVLLALHHDRPGEEGAAEAGRALRAAGARVRTLDWTPVLAGIDGAKDAADAIRAGRGEALAAAVRNARGIVRWRSVQDLADEGEEGAPWIVRGLLVRGGATLFSGLPKAGKSTFTFGMLKALEQGHPFAGFETIPTPAVYLTEEDIPSLHEKAHRFGLRGTRFLIRREMRPELILRDFLREGVEEAHRVGAQVMVLDTLPWWARFDRDGEKDSGATLAAMAEVLAAAAQGVGIWIVHHVRKSGDGDEGQGARCSGAIVGSVDVALELRRLKEEPISPFRALRAWSRYAETPAEELVLELRGPEYVRAGSGDEARTAASSRKVADFLRSSPEPATREEVLDGVGGKRESAARALKAMLDSGQVLRTGAGKARSPFCYALRKAEPVPPVPNPSPSSGTTGREESRPARPARIGGTGGQDLLPLGAGNAEPVPPGRDGTQAPLPEPDAGGVLPAATAEDREALRDLVDILPPRKEARP